MVKGKLLESLQVILSSEAQGARPASRKTTEDDAIGDGASKDWNNRRRMSMIIFERPTQ